MFIMIYLICWCLIISNINMISLLFLGFIIIIILPLFMMMTNDTWFYRCYRLGCEYLMNSDLISVELHQYLCYIDHQCWETRYSNLIWSDFNCINISYLIIIIVEKHVTLIWSDLIHCNVFILDSCDQSLNHFITCFTHVYYWDYNIYLHLQHL